MLYFKTLSPNKRLRRKILPLENYRESCMGMLEGMPNYQGTQTLVRKGLLVRGLRTLDRLSRGM